MPHFGINQRSFPLPKVFALRRNGVRIAPFYCALNTVLLCGLRRIMHIVAEFLGMFCIICERIIDLSVTKISW